MNIEIANRLAQQRKDRGLSQEQLAEQLGVSRQAVSKWERAESAPDTDNLIALAQLYQISIDELLGRAASATESAPEHGERREPLWRFEDEHGNMRWKLFPFPVVVVIVYLLLGLLLDLWHPGWLVFLTIPMYYTAIEGNRFNLCRIPFPLLVVSVYLILGVGWDFWHPSWLILLSIPLYYTICGKRLQSNLNLIVIAIMIVLVFSLMGWALLRWNSPWMIAGGLLLCGLGIWQTLDP